MSSRPPTALRDLGGEKPPRWQQFRSLTPPRALEVGPEQVLVLVEDAIQLLDCREKLRDTVLGVVGQLVDDGLNQLSGGCRHRLGEQLVLGSEVVSDCCQVLTRGSGDSARSYYGGSPGDPEGWFSAIGFGAPFMGAGGMALVGTLRRRAGLVLMAVGAVIPMAMMSIVLIPLIIPSIVLVVQAGSAEVSRSDLALGALLAVVLVGTMAVLVLHQDPAQWPTPDGRGSSSNIVTTAEAGLAIAAAATVNLIAALTRVDAPDAVRPS